MRSKHQRCWLGATHKFRRLESSCTNQKPTQSFQMSFNTKFCSILPVFCCNFKVKLWTEFNPLLGVSWGLTGVTNSAKQNLTPCCHNAHLIQTDTVLVANSTRLSKSVMSMAKDMLTLVLGTHPCRSNHFVTDWCERLIWRHIAYCCKHGVCRVQFTHASRCMGVHKRFRNNSHHSGGICRSTQRRLGVTEIN